MSRVISQPPYSDKLSHSFFLSFSLFSLVTMGKVQRQSGWLSEQMISWRLMFTSGSRRGLTVCREVCSQLFNIHPHSRDAAGLVMWRKRPDQGDDAAFWFFYYFFLRSGEVRPLTETPGKKLASARAPVRESNYSLLITL